MKTFAELATMQESLEKFLGQVIPHIEATIAENNNDLITHSLAILKQAFRNTEPQEVSLTAQSESSTINNFLNKALEHNQSRIVSETLRVTGMFIIQLQDLEGKLGNDYHDIVKQLHGSILTKLQKQDIDQEVKQSSIICMAQLLNVSHSIFSKQ